MSFHKQRGESRTPLAIMARMRFGDRERDTLLANCSSRGVLAMAPNPPKRGTRVTLEIGDRRMTGRVRWATADRCGIALVEAIRVADLVQGRIVFERVVTGLHNAGRPAGVLGGILGESPLLRRVLGVLLFSVLLAGVSYAIVRAGSGKSSGKSFGSVEISHHLG